ncbi:hypothetical protein PY365_28170 [Roseiarcaceae bacterium H3SJ34-1]|uniref:hypothetical protein n=1 Tax=Terripilifer ovatus TaxID=3032367 RepID=UPI003AB9B538|nr:hypothetical protein [Roseiarcaceae bacterium H3SJ34-1]
MNSRKAVVYAALVLGVLLFGRVSLVYLFDTATAAVRANLQPASPVGLGNLRVFAGAFHLAVCLTTVAGLIYQRYATAALANLVIVTLTVAATRWLGAQVDGDVARVPAVVETSALVIFALALWIGTRGKSADMQPA